MKSIKVTEEVYDLIRKYQAPREPYSQVIERAFDAFEVIDKIQRGEFPIPAKEPTKLSS